MKTALVVEDLPDICRMLADLLAGAFPGIQVRTAATRADGLAQVRGSAWDLVLIDLGLPDGSGLDVVREVHARQPQSLPVVVTIFDDDEHLFPALQAGAFGYLLKQQPPDELRAQMLRIAQGEPPLSPPVARRVLAHFAGRAQPQPAPAAAAPEHPEVRLTERETAVLQCVARGYTMPEIAEQFGLSRHTVADYIKQVYRKLNVSSRAEAALEALRRGLVQA